VPDRSVVYFWQGARWRWFPSWKKHHASLVSEQEQRFQRFFPRDDPTGEVGAAQPRRDRLEVLQGIAVLRLSDFRAPGEEDFVTSSLVLCMRWNL
jgi:hypothetical protein